MRRVGQRLIELERTFALGAAPAVAIRAGRHTEGSRIDGAAQRHDETLIGRCLELACAARAAGELPFGSVIALGATIIAEGISNVRTAVDVSAHAGVMAIRAAEQRLATDDLTGFSMCSSIEPCGMCALLIRERRFSRVVVALASPLMGGYSKWPMLQNETLARAGSPFGPPPEVTKGILAGQAAALYRGGGVVHQQ